MKRTATQLTAIPVTMSMWRLQSMIQVLTKRRKWKVEAHIFRNLTDGELYDWELLHALGDKSGSTTDFDPTCFILFDIIKSVIRRP